MANVNRTPVTPELLECLVRIKNLNEFKAFREYLEAERKYDMAVLAGANEDRVMHLSQGAYRRTDMIIDLIEQSPMLLEKHKGKLL